ncbi:MAG: hypothetical protein COY09_01900 [Candidatus Portnoybacteria bacterium CG_4_10_14_0_2_um_filter_39_11]|uniref:histidine kinase n=1 Tax=Candidatus Portnoybacteria bacterium CG_4_10_14_0_2_um_filter_39_11 TaxID=1974797 RepID=A0A2M7UI53_9BACT|nr:MAG: hypothetical protein COY09_01900 [Candidatus Portnoybacteria bacterium CG_4_10_14_0_2_um_filter_39_11]
MVLGLVLTSIIVCSTIALGLLAYFKNRQNATNKIFAILAFWIVAFIASNFWENESTSIAVASLSLRLDFFSAAFMVYFWLVFCINFPRPIEYLNKAKQIMIALPAMIFALLSFTPWLIHDIRFGERGIDFDFGYLYPFYVVYIVGYMLICSCGILILKYRKAHGLEKTQILYVLLGLSVSATIGIAFNLFLQRALPIELFRIGIYGIVFFVGSTAYAIVKYRLMDVRMVIKKGTVYLLSFALVVALAVVGVTAFVRMTGELISRQLVIVSILVLILSLFVFNFVRSGLEKIANKYLFVSLYNYQEAIRSLGQQLTRTIDLTKIIDTIIKSTADVMKLDKAGVLLRDEASGVYQIQKIVGFKEENGISFVKDNFLTEYLQKTGKPLVHEELRLQIRDAANSELRQRLSNLRDNMKKIEAAICLPLFREAEIQGLIVLGNKISKDAYSSQDIELLETLASQASVAIENGRLYDQVQDLTQHLQEKVDEQTKHLKKLFEVKTEFLHIVSHQLRTPLTALRGLLSMWSEGAFESYSPEEKQKVKQRISISCERLNNITNDMLDTLDLEEGYAKFILEPLDTAEIIDETVNFLKPNFDKKGLFLEFKKPEKSLPHVLGDKQYLPQSFQNLIDNAEKYTPKGGLTITLSQPDSNHIQISFKDTGIGVILQEKEHLFKDKFFRGERADKINTAGSGLGLYIVKNIIDGHHGTVGIKSAGPNQGTEFIVSLPVAK